MKKIYVKSFLLYLVCTFMLFSLTGCEQVKSNFINTGDLGSYGSSAPSNHEMVKLNNGVVIYRDNTNAQAPSGYSNVSFAPTKAIRFGPDDLNFSPKDVNPK